MSLNGLDRPDVQEAYQAAIAEAGGWILLKYASRDSIELLGRGKGGVHEARAAIAKYEEKSPLYGVIVYRRRKVLIKCIPEGTSRVLLARTAVHFQDVLEKYSPYEALLEISTADGLNDTSLAASFPLHTATPSAASKLDEINEDGEDPGPPKANPAQSPATRTPTGSYFSSQRHRMERRMLSDRSVLANRSPTQSIESTQAAARPTSPLSLNGPSSMKSSVSQFLVRSDSGKPSITSLGSDSLSSMAEYAPSEGSAKDTRSSTSTVEPFRPNPSTVEPLQQEPSGFSSEPSFSETVTTMPSRKRSIEEQQRSDILHPPNERESFPTRPSIAEQTNYETDLFDFLKPKAKLAPRPVTASERAKRPTVATVSSIPTTYRLSMRKQEQPQQSATGPISKSSLLINKPLPTPPPIPESPDYNPRPLSRGSIKSLPSHKSTAMTPDKLRLMKAVELRKKQLRKSNPVPEDFVPPADGDAPVVPKLPEDLLAQDNLATKTSDLETAYASPAPRQTQHDDALASYKADSGIEMDYEKGYIQESTQSKEAAPVAEPETFPSERTQEPSEDSFRSLPRESPQLHIPGAFSDTSPPDVQQLEPTMDAGVHLADEDLADKQPADRPIVSATPMTTSQDEAVAVPRIVMGDGSRPITPGGEKKQDDETKSVGSDVESKPGYETTSSSGDLAAVWERSPKRKNSDLARRRQGYVEPLPADTDTEFSDDEFIGELQNAQVVQAKHVTVSRSSPVQEFFPSVRRPSAVSRLSDRAAISKEPDAADPSSSASTDSLTNVAFRPTELRIEPPATYRPSGAAADASDTPTPLKRNVSSEISKRIQALAGTSSRENSPTSPNMHLSSRPLTPDSSSILSGSRNPTHMRNRSLNAFTKISSKANPSTSQQTAHTSQSSQSGPVWFVQHDPNATRDSVSVTARIVRPKLSEQPDSLDGAEVELQQSQLTINHKRGTPSQTSIPQLQRIDTPSDPPAAKQESASPMNPVSPTLSRQSKESSRTPYSNTLQKAATSPIIDDLSINSTSPPLGSNDENVALKGGNRTSRFFKRMSHIGSKRKSGMHQLVEGSNLATAIANAPSKEKMEVRSIMLPAVTVGDLNIQFPDSLLWKRRIVAIDDAGYLNLQPAEHQKAHIRRFRLADFKMPYVPDQDRQELPNSIMLDFVDGLTLQIACEDSVTHLQVSHVLRTYWKAWANARSGT